MVALNLIVSLYYYLRVVRAVFMDKNEQPIERIKGSRAVNFGLAICGAGILLAGVISSTYNYIHSLLEH